MLPAGNHRKRGENNGGSVNMPEWLVKHYSIPPGKPKAQLWQSILERLDDGKQNVERRIFRNLLVAAVIVALIGVGALLRINRVARVQLVVPRAGQLTHLLPDGSRVIVNADTHLSYNRCCWSINREVYLEGEALFRVKKGNRFRVVTPAATVSVLGTVFNVYSRRGETRVSCLEGKVRVKTSRGNSKMLLTKGMEIKTMGYTMERIKSNRTAGDASLWTKGEFYFNNQPIYRVIEELERQFDVDIFFDGDSSRAYSGYFNRNDLTNALQMVCVPMGIHWRSHGKVVILSENSTLR